MDSVDNRDFWDWALRVANPRQAQIIRLRMEGLTLDEIGRAVNLSRERVRQVYARGVRRIQNACLVGDGLL